MEWYKAVSNLLDREFKEQFVMVGYGTYIEYGSRTINVRMLERFEGEKCYLVLNFVYSSGEQKNVLNRIRNVIKNSGYYSGIIHEDVISTKVYNKLKGLNSIPTVAHVKEDFNEDVQCFYDMYYGTFIERF